jgi:hypothetical protein
VAVCVGVFIVFGLIANEGKGARDYLDEIRSGSANRRWHAAFELSKLLQAGKDRALADPRFVPEVLDVYKNAAHDDPRVRRYLTLALGRLHDARATAVLAEVAGGEGAGSDGETQIYAVLALSHRGSGALGTLLLPAARTRGCARRWRTRWDRSPATSRARRSSGCSTTRWRTCGGTPPCRWPGGATWPPRRCCSR